MKVTGRDNFKRYKPLINLLVKIFSVFGTKFNMFLLNSFRNIGGILGLSLRYTFLKNCCGHVGDNVSIRPGVYLFNVKNLKVGNNVSIHPMCYIDASGGLNIGNNVSIAHNCSILTANHQWNNLDVPIKYNKQISKPVLIEDDVWIGCGVRILAGVTISKRSVVAAGAVVNKDVGSFAIYGGIPAKKIKDI